MIIREASFVGSFVNLADCPADRMPEFAFIGRSNVGKSSLINYLTGYSALAKTSSVPGKTQTLNFYLLNSAMYLVDLPGYGYAKVAQAQRKKWDAMIRTYLTGRETLLNTFLLVDGSIPPQQSDIDFANWLGASALPFSIIYTKTDKRRKTGKTADFEKKMLETWETLPPVFSTSATRKTGKADVLRYIAEILKTWLTDDYRHRI